jgi:hypothetical protein
VPELEGLLFWKLIEGVVDFHGVEMPRIVLKPLVLGQTSGIKQP